MSSVDPVAPVVANEPEVADSVSVVPDGRIPLKSSRDESRRRPADGQAINDAVAELETELRFAHSGWQQPEWIGFAVASDASAV